MAESIVRLRVDSQEYDNKLKRAAEALNKYAEGCRKAGGTLEHVDEGVLEYARSLGKMETVSASVKGKLNEMTKAFNDTYVQYKQLTDAEKTSPYGKALSESLDQLKGRVQDTKASLKEAADILNGNDGGKGGGGGSIAGMLQVFGGNMMTKGVTALVGGLTDAVGQSIELAKQSEGVKIAFDRLNQPGLLDNLKEATHGTVSELELMKAAVKFEDFKLPVEELGTMLAFAQQKAKDTGQSVDYMVDSIVTGLGRKSLMILDNLGLSASQVKERMAETGDMTKAVADIIKEQMSEAGEYVETAADRAARAAADAQNELMNLGNATMPVAESVTEMWNTIRNGGITLLNTVLTPIANSLKYINDLLSNGSGTDLFEKRLANTPGMEVGPNVDDHGNYIRRPSHGTLGWNWNTGHYDDEVSSIPEIVVSGTTSKRTNRRGGGGKKTPSVQDYLYSMYRDLGNMNANSLKGKPDANFMSPFAMATDEAKKNMLGLVEATEDLGGAMAKIGEADVMKEMNDKIQKQVEAVNATKKAWSDAGKAVGMVGNIMSSIKDPAAQTAGAVAQAIANIALAYSQALGEDGTIKTNIWYFIAATAAAMTSMATTISSIHSATGYAEGGMVNGSTYSGDQVPIMANAGEVVLTKAQQGNLASQLQGGGLQNLKLDGVITGENIHIVHNRYLSRTGQGEIVTW